MGSPISDAELHRRQALSQRAFHRALAAGNGGRLLELPGGVQATIVPAAPRLWVLNAVFYRDPASLSDAIGTIEDAYAAAQVSTFAVWLPPGAGEVARMLRGHGYRRGMPVMVTAASIEEMALERESAIELLTDVDPSTVGRCNERAFGLDPGSGMAQALSSLDPAVARPYAAAVDGRLAAAGFVCHDGDNCYPWGLAAVPGAIGSLAPLELMRVMLRDALQAGCETVTGEVTRAGELLGAYLGKRQIGRYDIWVRTLNDVAAAPTG